MDGTTSTGPAPPEPPLAPAAEGTPLYVHLPFCAAKCHYCDFFSVPDEGHDLEGMVAAILREAEERAPRRPRTLFLGGGTPSLLPIPLLRRLLDGLHEFTGWRDSVEEATAECNPESLDRDKARAFVDLGVPRLSVGVQALDDQALALFGRVHTADDSLRALEAAREGGVEALNADLIYAWPGQTLEAWEHDVHAILGFSTEHLSAYNLTYEEDTRFKRWLDRGTSTRPLRSSNWRCSTPCDPRRRVRAWAPMRSPITHLLTKRVATTSITGAPVTTWASGPGP